MTSTNVRVRIAPSPTGDPHIGTAFIALYNFVFAKKMGGKFIIRIEDTDQKRYRKSSEEQILKALAWLGLTWDEGPDCGGSYGPYRQSERKHIYKQYAEELVAKNHAYYCFCTPQRLEILRKTQQSQKLPTGYDGFCKAVSTAEAKQRIAQGEPYVIRMKAPTEGKVSFQDTLRGFISFDANTVDDQVLLKADGFPTYHLAVVVDDHLMEITHVIRGEEWISSTPKHVLLYEMFGWQAPVWVHLPLLRNADRSKISKRKNPTSILYYKRKGILPEALCNFLALMGWHPNQDTEKFVLSTMIEQFALESITLGGPVFDIDKLSWLNGVYLKEKSLPAYKMALQNYLFNTEYLDKVLPLVQERVEKLEDFIQQAFFFFAGDLVAHYEKFPIIPKHKNSADLLEMLGWFCEKLDILDDWNSASIEGILQEWMATKQWKTKDTLLPVRIIITGTDKSPPLFACMEILGKDICTRRLRTGMDYIESLNTSV
jgi:glutamyl-tRNA synthetase